MNTLNFKSETLKKLIAFVCYLTFLASCSMFLSEDPSEFKNNELKFIGPTSKWGQIDPATSDFAIQNKETKSMIIFNSLCRKYKYASQEQLIQNILTGIDHIQIKSKKEVIIRERPGLSVSAIATIEGHPLHIVVKTFQKYHCIYDVVLIAQSHDFLEKDALSLDKFIDGLEI